MSNASSLRSTSDAETYELRTNGEESISAFGDLAHTEERSTQELKPTDGGRDAWTLLIAAFVFEALFWGYATCFGVFQNYYSQLPEFKGNKDIPLIGTLAQGLFCLCAPLSAAVTKAYPRHQRHQIWFGWPMCIVGLLAGSFTSSVGGLIATQGVTYGLGFVTLTYPILSFVNEWWISRKGMAFGLISAASGVTGVFLPFVIDAMLNRYGYRITLRANAVAMAILTLPLIPLLKGRLPPSSEAALARTDWSFLREPLFWIYAAAVTVQGLGFFFPPVYLPSYASSIGIPSTQGALLLAVMALSQVLGQFAFGYLSDKRFSANSLTTLCCIVASVATFALWGMAKSVPLLVVFSIVYGFFAYGFGTMRVAMAKAVSNDQSALLAMYSIFVFLLGIGNVLVGPISAGLLFPDTNSHDYAAGMYKALVLFTGATSCLSAFVILSWPGYRSLTKHFAKIFGS